MPHHLWWFPALLDGSQLLLNGMLAVGSHWCWPPVESCRSHLRVLPQDNWEGTP